MYQWFSGGTGNLNFSDNHESLKNISILMHKAYTSDNHILLLHIPPGKINLEITKSEADGRARM